MSSHDRTRRRFLQHTAAIGGLASTGPPGILRAQQSPGIVSADSQCPMASWGLQIGDVLSNRAIVWSRSDKPARMLVEWALDEDFGDTRMIRGPHTLLESSDSA